MSQTDTRMPARWWTAAACQDAPTDIFFARGPAKIRRALEYCARCPVRRECADAGAGEDQGVWGGHVRHRVDR